MNQTESLPTRVRAARDAIEYNVPTGLAAPIVGIVLGTGMGSVTSLISDPVRVPYSEIPFFQTSTVEGHAGELVFGRIDSVPIVALNGRCHFYEGYSTDEICFPIEVLCSFQIASLIIGNASGGINPKFKSGEVMLLDDHIDLFFRVLLVGVRAYGRQRDEGQDCHQRRRSSSAPSRRRSCYLAPSEVQRAQ